MFTKSPLRYITQSIFISFLAGSLVWTWNIIQAARALRPLASIPEPVVIGPFILHHLSSYALPDGGYALHISFETGFFGYSICVLAVGLGLGGWRTYHHKHKQV